MYLVLKAHLMNRKSTLLIPYQSSIVVQTSKRDIGTVMHHPTALTIHQRIVDDAPVWERCLRVPICIIASSKWSYEWLSARYVTIKNLIQFYGLKYIYHGASSDLAIQSYFGYKIWLCMKELAETYEEYIGNLMKTVGSKSCGIAWLQTRLSIPTYHSACTHMP